MFLGQEDTMKRNAFTLVELLVVITIIALLVGILLPMISNSKEAANLAKCGNNLGQIGKGLQMYIDEHDETFPSVWFQNVSWDTQLLPYLSDSKQVFRCPSDPYPSATGRTYSANAMTAGGADVKWKYPFGRYDNTPTGPLKLGDMDNRNYLTGDIIYIGERPYDIADNPAVARGYAGGFAYSGMDAISGWIHRKNTGANYLMGSGAVRFFLIDEAKNVGTTNYWLASEK